MADKVANAMAAALADGSASPTATDSNVAAAAAATPPADTSSETKAEPASEIKTEPSLLEGAKADDKGAEKAEAKNETKSDAAPAEPGKDGKDTKDAKPTSETKDKGDGKTPPKAEAKAEAKDGEKSPAEPGKDAAVEKPPAQSEPHAFEAFTVPDGTKLDDKQVATFTGILNNAEFSPQQRAQALVDMHVGEMQRLTQQAAQQQRDVWTQQQNRWRDDFRADKEIGGNRAATSLGLAKSLIEELGGTEEEVKATLAMLSYTGAGNHVGLIRVLHNAALRLSREGEPDTADPPNSAQGKSRQEKWYGANGKATP